VVIAFVDESTGMKADAVSHLIMDTPETASIIDNNM
jgi:hypothetical protein